MEKILELYHEKEVLTRWLIVATIFFFIPGIALGLVIQINVIDKKIKNEVMKLKDRPEVVMVVPCCDKAEKEEKAS